MQDKSSGQPRQFPVDPKSPTPLVDAIQLAQQGYSFTDEEVAKLIGLATASYQRRQRERRNAIRAAGSSDVPLLESAIAKLNGLLDELPYLLQDLPLQTAREPRPQLRQPPQRPAQPRSVSPNPVADIPRNQPSDDNSNTYIRTYRHTTPL